MEVVLYKPTPWGGKEEAAVIRAIGLDDGGIYFVHISDIRKHLENRELLEKLSDKAKIDKETAKAILERMLKLGEDVLIFEIM